MNHKWYAILMAREISLNNRCPKVAAYGKCILEKMIGKNRDLEKLLQTLDKIQNSIDKVADVYDESTLSQIRGKLDNLRTVMGKEEFADFMGVLGRYLDHLKKFDKYIGYGKQASSIYGAYRQGDGFAATLAFTKTLAPGGISEMLDFYLKGYISASKKIPDIALYSESSIDSLKNLVSSLRQGKDCCEVEEMVYYAFCAPRDCKNMISKKR